MSEPTPARYRTTNWPSYSASLCKRGSLLIWLDKEMIWLAPYDGRPAVFSDAVIQFCLTIKVLFKLPLRQTTGMVAKHGDQQHKGDVASTGHVQGKTPLPPLRSRCCQASSLSDQGDLR